MNCLSILRIINEADYEKAKKLAEKVCYEFSADYKFPNYISITKEINAREFLSLYSERELTEEETSDWILNYSLDELYDLYSEEELDGHLHQIVTNQWGEDIANNLHIENIDTDYNENNDEWILAITFTNLPEDCYWTSAKVINKEEKVFEDLYILDIEEGETKALSEIFKNNKKAKGQLVIDANGNKDEYERLIPVAVDINYFKNNFLSVNDTLEDCSLKEYDYTFILGIKY